MGAHGARGVAPAVKGGVVGDAGGGTIANFVECQILRHAAPSCAARRAGGGSKSGMTAPNAPRSIDGDERGEWKVIQINQGAGTFPIGRGSSIAQLVAAPVQRADFAEVADLDTTEGGTGGFGSTGV